MRKRFFEPSAITDITGSSWLWLTAVGGFLRGRSQEMPQWKQPWKATFVVRSPGGRLRQPVVTSPVIQIGLKRFESHRQCFLACNARVGCSTVTALIRFYIKMITLGCHWIDLWWRAHLQKGQRNLCVLLQSRWLIPFELPGRGLMLVQVHWCHQYSQR